MDSESTQCELQGLFKRRLVAAFDEPNTSSDGGALLLKAADQRLGLTDALARSMKDPRCRAKVRHECVEMLRQRVFGIGCGWADGNDAARLKDDPVHQLLVSAPAGLASQPTLSRLENSVSPRDLLRMSVSMLKCVLRRQAHRLKKSPRVITIDLDVTDDPTHGQQELTFFHGYYLNYCYLPLLAFLTFNNEREQHLAAAMLRPGNFHDTQGAVPLLKRIIKQVQVQFPGTLIRVRMDAGFRSSRMLDFLETIPRLEYAIGMAKNRRILGVCEPGMKRVRRISARTGRGAREFGDFRYAAGSWSRTRRIVFKAEVVQYSGRAARDNQRFVVTNMKQSPEWLYSRFYVQRGDVENRIKELIHALQIDRTSCSSFLANQFRVLLAAAAYLLIQEIRACADGTDFENAQAATIMLRLLKIGVRVQSSVRRIVFHLPRGYPERNAWMKISRTLLGAA